MSWKKLQPWKIKLLTILIFVLSLTGLIIYGYSGEPPVEKFQTYKGVWTPAFPMTAKMLLLDIKKLKEDGVNTLSFGPFYHTDKNGKIHNIPLMKQLTILFIKTAHRNGFQVFLVPNYWGPGFSRENINQDYVFEQTTKLSLEWAKIAEKYGVEMYAPSNEPNIMIRDRKALNKWYYKMAQEIKKRYSGILVNKVAIDDWGFDNDYRGYDYVGLDIFPFDQTLERLKQDIKHNIKEGLKFAERDGAKGVIFSEIGVQLKSLEGEISTTETPFSEDYQKQAYEIFFEQGQDNINGYVFCCWDGNFFGPDGYPAEEVMKEWFNKL